MNWKLSVLFSKLTKEKLLKKKNESLVQTHIFSKNSK